MKKAFWRKDWFAGVLISLLFLFLAQNELIQGLERSAYDFGVKASQKDPGDQVVIIAIDDQSLDSLGRWPWPRDILANMVDKLSAAGAKVIGNTILMSEAQTAPESVDNLIQYVESSNLVNENQELQKLIDIAKIELNRDEKLAQSYKNAGNVVLGMQFELGEPLGNPDEELPQFLQKNSLVNIGGNAADGFPHPAISATPPISVLGEQAAALGHLSIFFDVDGGIRSEVLTADYYGTTFPSLALQIAAKSLNLNVDDIQVELGKSVSLGNLEIITSPLSHMYPFYYVNENGTTQFSSSSFFDVYEDKINPAFFKDKIVLIGATALGVGTTFVTPVSDAMQPVFILANSVASILKQNFFVVPDWAYLLENLVFLTIALFLILILPRLSAALAAIVSAVLFTILIGVSQYMLISQAIWLQLMLPACLLSGGYLLLITKRYLVTERGKLQADEASAESNRTLGLAYQQQGQLDMAFDKFRNCPMDDSMREPLYNLSLDFERKRQFNKAQSVLELLATFAADYRDVKEKIKRNKQLQDTFMFGAAGGSASNSTMMLDGDGVEKPMLGRYEVEKELGKGAMGVVYLGKDPKINRTVAIKTMALAQEFEGDELDEAKERFFREAETAGRLVHPNIVTIYDAGEEHDLAYIAMEFLKGHDLGRYTKADKLLPIANVFKLTVLAAEALSYAHEQNVVHRDIKPANIMYVSESSTIKLTDFGIARITDSSKTKTGMVLGTPSYMSPEQLAGHKVDGRSDLFSLGVMFYQLLTGELPFTGDSMASLMFKIANDPHPDILAVRPELANKAPEISAVLDKILHKVPEERYQSGEKFAADLRKCLKIIKNNAK
ncbi:MAG: CHASE2 domain-containing protein [Gammaproteobacteria bacterium]|nr:CHASE2 domain-containing protein [Gammaproteobacteria bacterium]